MHGARGAARIRLHPLPSLAETPRGCLPSAYCEASRPTYTKKLTQLSPFFHLTPALHSPPCSPLPAAPQRPRWPLCLRGKRRTPPGTSSSQATECAAPRHTKPTVSPLTIILKPPWRTYLSPYQWTLSQRGGNQLEDVTCRGQIPGPSTHTPTPMADANVRQLGMRSARHTRCGVNSPPSDEPDRRLPS